MSTKQIKAEDKPGPLMQSINQKVQKLASEAEEHQNFKIKQKMHTLDMNEVTK